MADSPLLLGERITSSRSRHLVFLAHVWLCAPFLFWWMGDPRVQANLGPEVVRSIRPIVGAMLLYLVVRTAVAFRHPPRLPWEYLFPPIDVVFISLLLGFSHRGPMSNLSLLYFLPMVQASGSLKVRWSLAVGFMVILGLGLATARDLGVVPTTTQGTALEVLQEDKLNVVFRVYFLVVISSLMAFQARIAAELRAKVDVAADRARIAGDMHDGVQGRLIALAQGLDLIGRVAPRDPARATELAAEGSGMARAAADELRFLVQRLRAPELQGDGFEPALRQYAHNVCERARLLLDFTVSGTARTLTPETENALFRIAQEALTNVVKHAEAGTVAVVLAYGSTDVVLEVRDDGRGIRPAETGGAGLTALAERAVERGGTLEVQPASRGTRLAAALPLEPVS